MTFLSYNKVLKSYSGLKLEPGSAESKLKECSWGEKS